MADTLRPRSSVEAVIDADGAVLLDVLAGTYYSLNTLGAEIWRDVEAQRTRDEIVSGLRERCKVPTLDRDVDAFLDALKRLQLLEVT